MLLTSISFLLFFTIVCAVYYCLPKVTWRLWFLLAASYLFYINLNTWCSFILLFSTIITYRGALLMGSQKTQLGKKKYLWGVICANVLLLGYFKYTNFIAQSLLDILTIGGGQF